MLDELRLSYAEFTLLNAAVALSRMISSAYWGEIARTYGNRRALQVSAVLVVPLPALWLVSEHTGYLLVLQLLAGFAWAGYELTLFLNFFDCTDEANRSRVLSLYNLGNGAAMVIGTLLGGLLLRHFGSTGYFHVFLASAVLRALSVLFLARRAGLRRPGEHTFENVFLRVISFRPGQGPRLRPLILNGDGAKPARPSARRPERDAEKNETTDFAP
jgi:MFS family permease